MAEVKDNDLYVTLSKMLSAIEEDPDMIETELRDKYIKKIILTLGWPENNIKSERVVKLATTNHRVDYDLSYKGKSKVAIEIKRPKESLSSGAKEQLKDYLLKLNSDFGLAFNGRELTILNGNGKSLVTWNFNQSNSIPKNVEGLIVILKKYVAYDSVTKKDFNVNKNKTSNAHGGLLEDHGDQKMPMSTNIDTDAHINKKYSTLFPQWIGIFSILILILHLLISHT